MENGPILYVGGDEDDRVLIADALADIGCTSKLINFDNGYALIEHLRTVNDRPFLLAAKISYLQNRRFGNLSIFRSHP